MLAWSTSLRSAMLPVNMRKTGQCPKCQHREILVLPLLDRDRRGIAQPTVASVTVEKKLGGVIHIPSYQGVVKLYTCRSCGFAETYVHDVESISVDAEGIELLKS